MFIILNLVTVTYELQHVTQTLWHTLQPAILDLKILTMCEKISKIDLKKSKYIYRLLHGKSLISFFYSRVFNVISRMSESSSE